MVTGQCDTCVTLKQREIVIGGDALLEIPRNHLQQFENETAKYLTLGRGLQEPSLTRWRFAYIP